LQDVETGGDMFLQSATVRYSGQAYTATNFVVAKRPGTLNLALDLRAFGLLRSEVISFTPTMLGGDAIAWTASPTLTPPVDRAAGVTLESVDIVLGLRADSARGDAPPLCGVGPCDYSALLTLLTGAVAAHVRVAGFSETVNIPIESLEMVGGL